MIITDWSRTESLRRQNAAENKPITFFLLFSPRGLLSFNYVAMEHPAFHYAMVCWYLAPGTRRFQKTQENISLITRQNCKMA